MIFDIKIGVDIQGIHSDSNLSSKIRFFHELSAMAKINKKDEMKLAVHIQAHLQSCNNQKCICKDRKSGFDATTKVYANTKEAIYKDQVFIKNMLLVFLEEGKEKFKGSKLLIFTEIMIYLEILGNIPKATALVQFFMKRHKDTMSYIDSFVLLCIIKMLDEKIATIEKDQNQGELSFQKVKQYDNVINQLK